MQRAHLLRIEDTRRPEPALLDSLLRHRDPALRAAAALTAGRLGGTAHREQLHLLAQEHDQAVAARSLFALGLRKDTSAVALGVRALDADLAVAVQGAWLLGEVGEPARAALVSALATARYPAEVRGALLLAAARLRPVPAAAVVPWVASADTGVAWRAAYVLARGRSAAGVRALLAVAASPAPGVREQSARGLARSVAGDSLSLPAIAALRRLVADPDAHVRVNAVRSLATWGRPEAEVVRAALRDASAGVRLTAAQSLDAVLDSAPDAWADAWRADTALVVRRAIAEGAARRGHDLLGEWSASGDWQRRIAVVEVHPPLPATAALARAIASRDHEDGRIRAAVAGVVARLADSATTREAARGALRTMLADVDVGVRTAALGALAAAVTPEDFSAALDAHARAQGDRDGDARLAFWRLADSALRRLPALPEPLALRVAALARPFDAIERVTAARIPRFAAWRDSTSPPRAGAWYVARAAEALGRPPVAVVETERGTVELLLHVADAPLTVHNFRTLADARYFEGQRFHRVVPNFVVQGGDPRGDGSGGPGYAIRDEINPSRYLRGTLGMALSGPHTGGSQFFVTHSPQPHLDGGYTVFGQLVSGGDTLDRIIQGDRIVRITIR